MADSLIVTRAVDWYPVHRLVGPILESVESWPTAGTLPWHGLADHDPAKWCALLDAAQIWALETQLRQEAMAEASKQIAAAQDWAVQAQRILGRTGASYIPRKAS
ncbi:DUF2742 domain-containing protein [Mycolicibacterium cosmeticum]|uniref:DUF2742 domain-containing protein n=1 Tax=Mycolicibacterium cosmeticum TaxID=258533 RepID=UPI0032046CB8